MHKKARMRNTRMGRGKSKNRKIRRMMKIPRSCRQHVRSQPTPKMETATTHGRNDPIRRVPTAKCNDLRLQRHPTLQ